MKKTLLITTMLALVTVTGFARTEVSHDEFKALDGPKVLVHYDDGSTELLDEQEYLERTINMTQEEMDDLHKVDEGTKTHWQNGNPIMRYTRHHLKKCNSLKRKSTGMITY